MKNFKSLKIFKIGGGIIDNSTELRQFLTDFSKIEGLKLLVHGGGKGANHQLKRLNIEPKMVEGRRITDQETLEVIVGFYAGFTNKTIVAELQSLNLNAIGISGADGNAIKSTLRKKDKIDFGFVGDLDVNSVNLDFFELLFNNGLTPVVCAITHNENGQLLNTNADTIASAIAVALSKNFKVELHFCFDKLGVMLDLNEESSLISNLNFDSYHELKQMGIVSDGMIPKLDNAFAVIQSGVDSVILEHSKNINNSIGTIIK